MSQVATVVDYAMQLAAAGSSSVVALALATTPTAAARIGFYGDTTVAAEKIGTVLGGVTGPVYTRNGSTVDANFPGAVTIAGNLTVNGSTTTINSTTVDVDDRVLRVNKSSGANDPVPVAITGISVYRGAIASAARDHVGLFWDESASQWKLAVNTGGDDATLGAYSDLRVATLTAASITLGTQTANFVYAGPTTGAAATPAFRALVAADLPATAVSAASYGSASAVGTFTVDAAGRLTAAASTSIAIAASQITSGTLGVTNGGNGLATATLGDIRYGSATNTLAALAGNTTTTNKFLTQTGNGSVSAAPAWATIAAGDIPALTTATYVIYGDGSGKPTGGAGLTYSANSLVVGDGTLNANVIVNGAAATTRGYLVRTNGSNRWFDTVNNTAESGANAGSDSQRLCYDDSGVLIGSVWTITRASGGAFSVTRPFKTTDTTEASAVGTAALTSAGGLGVAKRSYLGTIGSTFSGNVLAGVQDGTAAVSGERGEVPTSSVVSTYANYTSDNVLQAVTSLTLGPGQWHIRGFLTFKNNSATVTTSGNITLALSTTTASTTGTTEGGGDIAFLSLALNNGSGKDSMYVDLNVLITTSTTYYLNTSSRFSAGNPQYVGSITAVRTR